MDDAESFVRHLFEVFNAGDLDAAASYMSDDVMWYPHLGQVGGSVYHGREEILAMWRDINESLTGFRIEPLRVERHGARVVEAATSA